MARLLIADDNRDAADTLATLFELDGHEVEVAYDGTEAMKRSTGFRADLALIDINMPGADGYEVARHLRERSPSTIMIAMTGCAEETREKAFDAGFAGHFLKPFAAQRLIEFLGASAPMR